MRSSLGDGNARRSVWLHHQGERELLAPSVASRNGNSLQCVHGIGDRARGHLLNQAASDLRTRVIRVDDTGRRRTIATLAAWGTRKMKTSRSIGHPRSARSAPLGGDLHALPHGEVPRSRGKSGTSRMLATTAPTARRIRESECFSRTPCSRAFPMSEIARCNVLCCAAA